MNDDTKLIIEVAIDLKAWSLPFTFGLEKGKLIIGFLCFWFEVERVKYQER